MTSTQRPRNDMIYHACVGHSDVPGTVSAYYICLQQRGTIPTTDGCTIPAACGCMGISNKLYIDTKQNDRPECTECHTQRLGRIVIMNMIKPLAIVRCHQHVCSRNHPIVMHLSIGCICSTTGRADGIADHLLACLITVISVSVKLT
jgi:hypothetical protein